MTNKITAEARDELAAVLNDRLAEVVRETLEQFTEQKHDFQVGTRVEVLTGGANYANVDAGDRGTVVELEEDTHVLVDMDNGTDQWYFRVTGYEIDVKLVDPAEEAEEQERADFPFPVGTRVRVLEDGAWLASVSKGDTAEVIEIITNNPFHGTYCQVCMDNGDTWYFRATDIEAVEAAEWAEGDRVLCNGAAGTIEWVMAHKCCGDDEVCVKLDDGGWDYVGEDDEDLESLDEREFTPVEYAYEGEELTLIDERGDSFAGIKVGEKVTVTRGNFYEGGTIAATTKDGRATSRYAHRFGR